MDTRRLCTVFVLLFAVSPLAVWAQVAPDSIAKPEALPMRNLQIEVRQLRGSSQSQSALGASGVVVLQPGQSRGHIDITAQNRQRSDAGELVQRVLVLNGRSANVMLGNSVPLRLLQSFMRHGVLRYGSATVLVEANSGFSARPLWRGDNLVELELGAVQSQRGAAPGPSGSSVVSTLVVPLNEWVTVAESDEALSSSASAPTGNTQSSSQSGLTVQVRMSVR